MQVIHLGTKACLMTEKLHVLKPWIDSKESKARLMTEKYTC